MLHTSWLTHTFLIFSTILLVHRVEFSQSESVCPHGCKCDVNTVDCLHSNLTSIPTNLPSEGLLQELKLTRNQIQKINLELSNYAELRVLDLTNNNISFISQGAFKNLSHLEELLLSRNFITKTEKSTFEGLVSLRHLQLSYNSLRRIRHENFQHLTRLSSLDLTRNTLSLIEMGGFKGLGNLEILNITRNNLDIFPQEVFQDLQSLKVLKLDDNKILSLPDNSFSKLGHLEYLSLTGNRLRSVSTKSFEIPQGQGHSLKELYLRGTDLEILPTEVSRSLPNLEVLDLSLTRIKHISGQTLSGLVSLKYFLLVSSDYLRSLSNDSFIGSPNLEKIVISHNFGLLDINNISFKSFDKLHVLDLSRNYISQISSDLVKWSRDIEVDLSGNPIACGCESQWFTSILQTVTNNITRTNFQRVYCNSPTQLKGQRVIALSGSDFQCETAKIKLTKHFISRAKIGAIAAGATCLVLMSCALLIKFRRRICSVLRRQYRYSSYRNKNGVFMVNTQNDDVYTQEDMTPMEDMHRDTDDMGVDPRVILVRNENFR